MLRNTYYYEYSRLKFKIRPIIMNYHQGLKVPPGMNLWILENGNLPLSRTGMSAFEDIL